MPRTTRLEIVTPERVVYDEDIHLLEGPAIDGEIGILPRHAPLVTILKTGVLKIKKGNEMLNISISGGFMEVKPDRINVVVRSAELSHEVDVERAQAARERAEERLQFDDRKDVDFTRAEAAMERALARIRAADDEIYNH